jgi:hypothetical protein
VSSQYGREGGGGGGGCIARGTTSLPRSRRRKAPASLHAESPRARSAAPRRCPARSSAWARAALRETWPRRARDVYRKHKS